MDSPERLLLYEPLETLNTQRKLAERKRSFARQASLTKPRQVLRQRVLRSVNDPEVLPATAFHGGLQQTASAAGNERERLDDGALAAGLGQRHPPLGGHQWNGAIRMS